MTKVKRLPESDKVARFYVFNANVMMNFDIEAKSEVKQGTAVTLVTCLKIKALFSNKDF